MAGNTLYASLSLQPAESTNIDSIAISIAIRQPTAGSTSNPEARMTIHTYPRDGYTSQSIRVTCGMGIQGDQDHDSISLYTSESSYDYETSSSWTTLRLSHSTGVDTWYFEASCAGGGGGNHMTKTVSGKIYWENVTPSPNTYYIYYQDNGSTIDTQAFTSGSEVTLRACSITKSGYAFNGWTNGGRTYGAGYKFYPTGNMWFATSWVEVDNTSTSQYLWIYAADPSDKIYASTSSIMGTDTPTSGNGMNGTNAVRINCTHEGTVLAPTRVEIIPDTNGNKNSNSFAIRVKWGNGDIYQEIVLGCSDSSVNGANWVTSHGITLSPTTNDTNPSSITVSRYNITGTKGSTVTGVTLNDYWVANQGYTSGASDTTVGSWNKPAIWYWHYRNLYNKSMDDSDFDWTYYRNEIIPKITRKISWTRPANGVPLYYVVMYWKGYYTTDERTANKLGFVTVVDGSSTSMTDSSGWFSGNYAGAEMKIVVHAVYAGGPNPTFYDGEANSYSSAATGMGKSAVEDYAIWWQWGTPPSLHKITFYEQDKSTILVDSGGNAYNYYAPEGANIIAPEEIMINGVDQTEAYYINGWYQKVGSGNWGTSVLDSNSLGTVGTSDLAFAQKITKRSYRVTYNDTSATTSSQVFDHGTTIYINNDNGTSTISYVVKNIYTIPVPTKTDYVFNGFTYNSSTKTFTAQWVAAARYIWIYTGTEWKKGIPWVYDGGWKKGKSAFVYSGGWKEEK